MDRAFCLIRINLQNHAIWAAFSAIGWHAPAPPLPGDRLLRKGSPPLRALVSTKPYLAHYKKNRGAWTFSNPPCPYRSCRMLEIFGNALYFISPFFDLPPLKRSLPTACCSGRWRILRSVHPPSCPPPHPHSLVFLLLYIPSPIRARMNTPIISSYTAILRCCRFCCGLPSAWVALPYRWM